MENTRIWLLAGTVSSLVLGGLLTARMTAAQAPEEGAAPRSRAAAGREAQAPGQPGGLPAPVIGIITEADPGNGTISFIPQLGGDPQSIHVTTTTRYSTQTTATVADLKVNDRVQVQGVPTGITASSILTGDIPDLPAGPGQAVRGGPGEPAAPGSAARPVNPNAGGLGGVQATRRILASANATGIVKSLSPLTIAIGSDVTITLHLAANAKVSKIVATSFSKLKRGDRLIATGLAGSDGMFTAATVAVNLDMAGLESGMFAVARPGGAGKPSVPGGAEDFVELGPPGSGSSPVGADAVALQLLQAKCGCHNGGGQGPDLSHEGSKRAASWLAVYIANPQSKDPRSRMPAMSGKVTSADITKMANYLAKAK